MPSNSHNFVCPASESERAYLESLIRADYERCHPGEALEDMKLRSAFSKEDRGTSSRLDGGRGSASGSRAANENRGVALEKSASAPIIGRDARDTKLRPSGRNLISQPHRRHIMNE